MTFGRSQGLFSLGSDHYNSGAGWVCMAFAESCFHLPPPPPSHSASLLNLTRCPEFHLGLLLSELQRKAPLTSITSEQLMLPHRRHPPFPGGTTSSSPVRPELLDKSIYNSPLDGMAWFPLQRPRASRDKDDVLCQLHSHPWADSWPIGAQKEPF